MKRQVFIMKTLSVWVHLNVLHQLSNVNISVRRRVAVGLDVHHRRQSSPQLVFVGQRQQVCLCAEGPEALQVLRGEGQVRAAAEGRRVVEQSNERLVKELVVILGWLLVKQRPLVLLVTRKRKTFNAEICTWKKDKSQRATLVKNKYT